jgi:hypothetical protein
MLQFMRPARPSWGLLGDDWLARMNETGRRVYWPAARVTHTPQHEGLYIARTGTEQLYKRYFHDRVPLGLAPEHAGVRAGLITIAWPFPLSDHGAGKDKLDYLVCVLVGFVLAMAFGKPCRVIAERVHADKGNMRGHRRKRRAGSPCTALGGLFFLAAFGCPFGCDY